MAGVRSRAKGEDRCIGCSVLGPVMVSALQVVSALFNALDSKNLEDVDQLNKLKKKNIEC